MFCEEEKMNKNEIAIKKIEKKFTVGNLLYLIDGKDKNPIYLVWDNNIDKYIIVTYHHKKLQIVFEMKAIGDIVTFSEIWRLLMYVLSSYEKHNN